MKQITQYSNSFTRVLLPFFLLLLCLFTVIVTSISYFIYHNQSEPVEFIRISKAYASLLDIESDLLKDIINKLPEIGTSTNLKIDILNSQWLALSQNTKEIRDLIENKQGEAYFESITDFISKIQPPDSIEKKIELVNEISKIKPAFNYIDKISDVIINKNIERTIAIKLKGQDNARNAIIATAILFWVILILLVVSWRREINSLNTKRESILQKNMAVESNLIAQDKARISDQAMHLYTNVITHEIRTPMQTLMTSLDLIESASESPDIIDATVNARNSLLRIRAHLKDLTSFSRDHSDGLSLAFTKISIERILKRCKDTYKNNDNDILIEFNRYPDNENDVFIFDEMRINQIIDNLIENSIKYTKHGRILVNIGIDENYKKLKIKVIDNGIGIPLDEIEKVTDPFFRASNVLSNTPGNGLGLAIVSLIVNRLNGIMLINNNLYKKTTFSGFDVGTSVCVDLPIPKKNKILIIDATPSKDFIETSAEYGECLVARNESEAFNILNKESGINIAFIGFNITDSSGVELAKKFSYMRNYKDGINELSIIGIPTYKDDSDDYSYFDEVYEKPISAKIVATIIEKYTLSQSGLQA